MGSLVSARLEGGFATLSDGSIGANARDTAHGDIGALIAAEAPDEPLFCFSPRQAHNVARRFRAGFPGAVTYAVKSNPTPDLVRAFVEVGITAFDVASTAEMALVRAILPDATLHYNNPIRSEAEIRQAISAFDVRHFAIDDMSPIPARSSSPSACARRATWPCTISAPSSAPSRPRRQDC